MTLPPYNPTSQLSATSLLLNGTDAAIIDKSQSVKTITLNGDVKSSTTQSKYLLRLCILMGLTTFAFIRSSDWGIRFYH